MFESSYYVPLLLLWFFIAACRGAIFLQHVIHGPTSSQRARFSPLFTNPLFLPHNRHPCLPKMSSFDIHTIPKGVLFLFSVYDNNLVPKFVHLPPFTYALPSCPPLVDIWFSSWLDFCVLGLMMPVLFPSDFVLPLEVYII